MSATMTFDEDHIGVVQYKGGRLIRYVRIAIKDCNEYMHFTADVMGIAMAPYTALMMPGHIDAEKARQLNIENFAPLPPPWTFKGRAPHWRACNYV